MAGLEQLDKHFRPQGPAPLGHEPEPEPEVERDRAVDLAEHGIAGWAAEMSHRPGCWTWTDGVIACKPGPNEYGWLRAPIEVGDFLLRVEWKVPGEGQRRDLPPGPAGDLVDPPGRPVQAPGPGARARLALADRPGTPGAGRPGPGQPLQQRLALPPRRPRRQPHPAGRPVEPLHRPGPGPPRRGLEQRPAGPRRPRSTAAADTLPDPPLRGYIGLQNHGAPAEYRNIRLQQLGD